MYVRAGAGIVADSVPERESAEVAAKAGAVLAALREAEAIAAVNRKEPIR
jgi:anthranilate synthase component 1